MERSEDIKAFNRLERNEKRLTKAIDILMLVQKENDLSDLMIGCSTDTLMRARDKITEAKKDFWK